VTAREVLAGLDRSGWRGAAEGRDLETQPLHELLRVKPLATAEEGVAALLAANGREGRGGFYNAAIAAAHSIAAGSPAAPLSLAPDPPAPRGPVAARSERPPRVVKVHWHGE
jgi:hypothetical protein